MTSVLDLTDQAARIARPENAREDWEEQLEPVMGELYDRLDRSPIQFAAFDRATQVRYQRLRRATPTADALVTPEPPDTTGGRFRYRNVDLGWSAIFGKWRWPPDDVYTAYQDTSTKGNAHLRVLGECYGMSPITHPVDKGAVLLTGAYAGIVGDRVSWADASKTRVKCVLGATYEEVHDFLDRDRTRCLANQPGFSLLTVAGNIGCGGHGSSLKQGSLAALVRSISIAAVDGGGGVTSYERGDPGFDDALTHLGRIGPVVAIVLDVVDRFRISETRELVILGDDGADWRVDLQALVDSTIALQAQPDVHSCELWIAPYADSQGRMTAVLGTRKYAPITAPIDTPKNQRPPALRSKALQTIAQVAAAVTARIHPRAIRPVLRWALHSTTTNHGPVVMEPREGLDFGALNENRTTTIESGIDISTSTSVAPLVDLFETLDTMGDAENLYLFSPIGVRFVGQGEKGGLSPQAGRARSMHVEISTFADDQWFHGSKILPRLQKLLAQAGGRPHWGLNVFLSSTELRALWPDAAWDGLKAMVAQTDQSGVFANPLLDPIVPIP